MVTYGAHVPRLLFVQTPYASPATRMNEVGRTYLLLTSLLPDQDIPSEHTCLQYSRSKRDIPPVWEPALRPFSRWGPSDRNPYTISHQH